MKIYLVWVKWERLLQLNYNIPPMGVLRIAGSTPSRFELIFTDEMVEPVDLESDADIIALSFLTPAAKHAYELAYEFKKRNKYVVLGGIHTTVLPEESAEHADTIVIGEGELVWREFLEDFECGTAKSRYHQKEMRLPERLPPIRRELLTKYIYPYDSPVEYGVESLETSRGCSSNCAYCVIPQVQGNHFRNIPIDDLLREFDSLYHTPGFIFFVDNNLLGNWQYTEKVLEFLRSYKKLWFGMLAPERLAEEPAKLELMVESGLCGVYGTVKAITGKESMTSLRKRAGNLRRLRELDVIVLATFALGWDEHDKDVFKRTVDFCEDAGLTVPEFIINTPFPGSRLFRTFEAQHRITTYDWSKYNGNHAVFTPRNMKAEELEEGYRTCYEEFYKSRDRDEALLEELLHHVFKSMKVYRKKQKAMLR